MGPYDKFSQLKYWIIYLCWMIVTSFYFSSYENRVLVFFLYSNNLLKAVFIFAFIMLSGIYYIHSILNFVKMNNEIKIRVGKKYNWFILMKILYSFLFACLSSCTLIYFILHDVHYVLINLFSILFQMISFLFLAFVLKKDNFSYILVLYFVINLAFRIVIANCSYVLV